MTEFIINDHLVIKCEAKNSRSLRYSFYHKAILYRNNYEILDIKISYINRTWESYEFQSTLRRLLEKARKQNYLSKEEENIWGKSIEGGWQREASKRIDEELGFIGSVASLGDFLADKQEDKNNFKQRMLKAGGLEFPEDWDQLSENEKENRLNKVINNL